MSERRLRSQFKIFISYRREDTSFPAHRLYDQLAVHFGEESIFIDVDTIEPGLPFDQVIAREVGACDVLIALIGDDWLTVTDAHGRRRLEDPNDWCRLEVEAALGRDHVRIIPTLVGGVQPPRAEELPPSMRRLAGLQAFRLSGDRRWREDVEELTRLLDKVRDEKGQEIPLSSHATERVGRVPSGSAGRVVPGIGRDDQPAAPAGRARWFGSGSANSPTRRVRSTRGPRSAGPAALVFGDRRLAARRRHKIALIASGVLMAGAVATAITLTFGPSSHGSGSVLLGPTTPVRKRPVTTNPTGVTLALVNRRADTAEAVAGTQFSLRATLVRAKPGAAVRCLATVGGKGVRGTGELTSSRQAVCRWQLAKDAALKPLRARILVGSAKSDRYSTTVKAFPTIAIGVPSSRSSPQAGEHYSVVFSVRLRDPGHVLVKAPILKDECQASVAGSPFQRMEARHSTPPSAIVCQWTVPASAEGQAAAIRLLVSGAGLKTQTRSVKVRVRTPPPTAAGTAPPRPSTTTPKSPPTTIPGGD